MAQARTSATVLIAVAVAFAGRSAGAEEPVSIVVTGSAAPSFVSKTTEGARPRDVADTASLFEGLPGMRVRRLGGDGSFATLSIRGASSNQVGVVLAGVPLTGAADPSLDLGALPLWPGASARVFRTFAPAQLGGGHLGGIVQLDPIGTTDKPRTEIYDALGSFGALRMRLADVRPIGGGWNVASGLSASRYEGDFTYFDPLLGIDVARKNASNAQVAGLVQARRDAGAWTTIVTMLLSTRRDGVAGPFEAPSLATRLFRDRELLALESRRTDDAGRFLVRAWVRREGRRVDDPFGEQGFGFGGGSFDRVLSAGSTFGRSAHFFEEKLVIDARIDDAIESSTGTRVFGAAPVHRRLRLGGALDATFKPFEGLAIALAARVDVRGDRGESAAKSEALPVAHLGFEQKMGEGLSIAGHAGLLARPPSFLELLGDDGLYTSSPDLKSERAQAADLGVRAAYGSRVRFELELVGFATRTRDLIVVAPASLRSLRAVNVGDAWSLGAEASIAARIGGLRALLAYTRLHTEDRTGDASTRGAPLPGRPAHDLTADVSFALGPLTLRYGLDVVSATTLDRPGLRVLPTRVFHGAGVKLDVPGARGLTLLAEVLNLFDQRTIEVLQEGGARPQFGRYPTSDFLGYPLPGRRFTVALRWTMP